jgi:CBS domain containing-hemolysin-like protein
MVVLVVAAACSLFFAFLCSISEAVLLSLKHSHVESLGQSRAGRILRQFKREIDAPIAAVLVLATTAHTMGASVMGAAYTEVFDKDTLLYFSAAFTLLLLVLSEIIPKTLGVTFAEQLAVPVAFGVRFLTVVLKPVLFLTRSISGLLVPKGKVYSTSLDEIRLLASLGQTEGALGKRVASMIEGAATLRELRARDVMVPRSGVIYLSGDQPLEKTLEIIRSSGHSRFPFSFTGDLDKIDGTVVVKDLMFQLVDTPNEPKWDEVLSKPLMVPSAAPLERLLRVFQEERRHMAIVLDEYGGTQGIVTLEDVLEEIVGEIEDESDRVNRFIVKRGDGSLLCRGWAEARKVFELFEVDAESDSISIGGCVAELVGRVPRVGDVVTFQGLEMRVTQASSRRAERIEVRRLPVAPD